MHLYTDVPASCFNHRIICFCSHDCYGIGLHEIRLEILPHASHDVLLGSYLIRLGNDCGDIKTVVQFSLMQSLFFELIRISVGVQKAFSRTPSRKEWEQLYLMAERQTVLGICFKAVKAMEVSVPQPVYMRWLAMAAKIQQRNEEMNRKCTEVYEAICREGFECAVLKGQGMVRYYKLRDESLELRAYSLGMLRQSGDIDVWLWKEGSSLKENRKEVIRFARTIQPDATGAEHHVGVEWMDTEVELHYEPAYFCNPFANRRFRKWFMDYDKSRFQLSDNWFCVPDADSKSLLKLLLAAVWLVLCAESNVCSILSDYV